MALASEPQVARVLFSMPLSHAYGEELERRVFFASAEIVNFRLITEDDLVCGLEVETRPGADIDQLADKINFLVANDVATQKILPPRVVWHVPRLQRYEANVFQRLVDAGLVTVAGEGQVAFGAPLMDLMDRLDERLKNLAITLLGAQQYRYPTLIPTRVLHDCGYLDSFPQLLMFVTRLHNDVDTYRAFQAEYKEGSEVESLALAYCQNVDYCLPPTMCYHTYHQLRDKQFEAGENRVVTSRGKSFRYESRYHHTLERLWDFTIREIVFLGSRDFCIECRQKFMEAALGVVAEEMGLTGHCEVASDPFFCSSETAAKILNQKLLALKYELRLQVDEDRTIAAGSFNFHDQFFGQNFAIRDGEGEWIRTGCVGFGLERLLFAFLCHHGIDAAGWPAAFR